MYPGYHLQNNAHALKQLNKAVQIPDARLAVGEGELHQPLAMKFIYKNKREFVLVPDLNQAAIENATIDGQRPLVNEQDFPKDNFFGDPIGRF